MAYIEDKVLHLTPQIDVAQMNIHVEENELKIQTVVENCLDLPMYVATREGVRLPVATKRSQHGKHIKIVYTLTYSSANRRMVTDYLNSLDNEDSKVMVALKDAANKYVRDIIGGNVVIKLTYLVSYAAIKQCGGSVYLYDLDLWVSSSEKEKKTNPFSENGMIEAMYQRNKDNNVAMGGAMAAFELIDNDGRFGDRFINLAGQVRRIRSKKDPTRRSGLYLLMTDKAVSDRHNSDPTILGDRLELYDEEGKETDFTHLHIYRNIPDAEAFGDVEGMRKQELMNREYELSNLKLDLEKEKRVTQELQYLVDQQKARDEEASLERKRLQSELDSIREKHATELKMERERIEHEMALERAESKDRYEERSQTRKETSEWVKVIPSIILGVIGLVTSILAYMKS